MGMMPRKVDGLGGLGQSTLGPWRTAGCEAARGQWGGTSRPSGLPTSQPCPVLRPPMDRFGLRESSLMILTQLINSVRLAKS